MIKLSSGVELSESTVISALKKAGISVEPKHVFEVGDIATRYGEWRFIVKIDGKLTSVGENGYTSGSYDQKDFEYHCYKYVGRQSDILKSN